VASSANIYLALKVPGKGALPPPSSPSGDAYGERWPVPELSFLPREKSLVLGPQIAASDPYCPRPVCKPNEPLDIHNSLWATNLFFSG